VEIWSVWVTTAENKVTREGLSFVRSPQQRADDLFSIIKQKKGNNTMLKKALASATLLALSVNAMADTATDTSTIAVEVENRAISIANTFGLNFGVIMPLATSGTVRVTPTGTGGTGSGSGGPFVATNVHMVDSSSLRRSSFEVTGIPGAPIIVTLPETSTVSNGTDSMQVDAFTRAGSTTLNASGISIISVGATLNVAAAQAPGTYAGSFDVTVNYP
jgi:hypothetical protein